MKKTEDKYAKYRFNKAILDEKKQAGISAFMRIKNGEEFLQLVIESHINFFDEIIACYNDCSDNTEKILQKLQKKYPEKVKIYHYQPKVYSVGSKEQKGFADGNSKIDEVHSLANYYNWTLAKTTKKIAFKLDDDILAVKQNLKKAIQKVQKNGNNIYYLSGVNLMRENGKLGVIKNMAFAGYSDHFFFPVSSKTYFISVKEYEEFFVEKPIPPEKYVGLLYLHLKFIRKCKGLGNYNISNPDSIYHQQIETVENNLEFIDMEKFAKTDISISIFARFKILNFLPIRIRIMLKRILLVSLPKMAVKRAFSFKQDIKPIVADWQKTQKILK